MHILIIDDHPLFREGLQFLLSDLSDGLVFNSASGVKSIEKEPIDNADLILLDLTTVDTRGLESLSILKEKKPSGWIVVISGDDDPDLIESCIEHGAAGFIPKTSEPSVLIFALRLILAGGIYLPPHCASGRHGLIRTHPQSSPPLGLTNRQRSALLLVAKGKTNKNIAGIMSITEGTVKCHLSAAFKTLNVNNRTEAVYALSRLGVTDTDTDTDTFNYLNEHCKSAVNFKKRPKINRNFTVNTILRSKLCSTLQTKKIRHF